MEEKEMLKFSWSIFFGVTAISFLMFGIILKFLEGSNSGLFMRVGLIIGVLSILSILNTYTGKKLPSSKHSGGKEQQDLF